ncbi:DUF6082 family protein [Streptomyces zaomyceticus]|uniref:DUF6082 family protein n=1 Tax=Streptomyces zaomyceticus TaxID=68286 RepID=UPI00365F2B05
MKTQRTRLLLWSTATVGLLLAIWLTPMALGLAAPTHKDWSRLSDVSQTYGALSVPLSAMALLGVAVSLVYQARQTKMANVESQRSVHRQLLMYSLDNPEFLVCWEPISGISSLEMRRLIFTNIMISNWCSNYVLRRFNDQEVRHILSLHFQGAAARLHWEKSAPNWRMGAEAQGDVRGIRFVCLVDESYAEAAEAGRGVPPEEYFTSSEPSVPSSRLPVVSDANSGEQEPRPASDGSGQ